MGDTTKVLFPEERTPDELQAFRSATPSTAVLTVFDNFSNELIDQIPKFDSDETLELVLRFPGLPDAIAGRIRGMQSYSSWLYYQLDEDGRKHGYHYSRFMEPTPIKDYKELLEEALGRKVEVRHDHTLLKELNRQAADSTGSERSDSIYLRSLVWVHGQIKAVIFDLDNTLAATDHLATYRRNRDQSGLESALRTQTPEVHNELLAVLEQVSEYVPVAVVTVAPRWYAERILNLLFPSFKWATIVTYEDVARPKPFPDAFRLAAERLNVDPTYILVVGDSRDDIEAAYHAGMQTALATWHFRDEEGLRFVPDTVLDTPGDLLHYLTSPVLGLPYLEAWLMDEDWEELDWIPPFPATTSVPGQPGLPVGILGRYFPNYDQTLKLHEKHLLSQQIITKERPGPFQIPEPWIHPLAQLVACQQVDIITVIPAKPGKDQRLERLLELIKVEGNKEYLPDLLRFTPGMKDVKRLSAPEKYAEVSAHLTVNGNCAGKRVLVLDDVLTQGATMQAATDKLLEAGASAVERMAIAKTVSPTLFRERDEVRHCQKCGAIMAHRRRKADQKTFWSCSQHFRTGCDYTENE